MEIEVIEKTKDTVKVRIQGGTQSIIPLLINEAKKVEGVFVGQILDHPLKNAQILIVKTEKGDASEALEKLINNALNTLKEVKNALDEVVE